MAVLGYEIDQLEIFEYYKFGPFAIHKMPNQLVILDRLEPFASLIRYRLIVNSALATSESAL